VQCLRFRFLGPLPIMVGVVLAGCAGNLPAVARECPVGRTLLDGVCVSEPVADYVSCVRAQGAQLDSEQQRRLSAEAGYLGVKAAGTADLSDSLQKRYSASDEAMLEIIKSCKDSRTAAGTSALSVAGEWSTRWEDPAGEQLANIHFAQSGNSILGTYGVAGQYQGTLEGRVLTGVWRNGQSSGAFEFTFAADVASFDGSWGFGSDARSFKQSGSRTSTH